MKRTSIRVHNGVRIATAYCALAAVYVINNNLADIVVVKANPELEELKELMKKLGGSRDSGPFDTIRDIRIDTTKTLSVAESSSAHPLHSDGSFDAEPPKYFLLQFVEVDDAKGGVSTFLSVPKLLKAMPAELRSALEIADVAFGRADDSGRFDAHIGPVLYPRKDKSLGFRWRDDHQVSAKVVDARGASIEQALGWVKGYIAASEAVQLSGEQGDIIVIHNDRVLHGRTALSGNDSKRWVRRAWLADKK